MQEQEQEQEQQRPEMLPPQQRVQRAKRQGLWAALRRDANWKNLLLTLLISVCLSGVTWCQVAQVTEVNGGHTKSSLCSPICPPVVMNSSPQITKAPRRLSPCEAGVVLLFVGVLVLLYCAYGVECGYSKSCRRLHRPRASAGEVMRRLRLMREARPVVWWRAVSYHYERRRREVTRYHRGDAYKTLQVYYERVNSHTATATFNYRRCGLEDASKDLQLLDHGPLTHITFRKVMAFANEEALTQYEEERARFFADNEAEDDYVEMREGMDVEGFREEQVVDCGDCLWWLHTAPAFWLSSLLLLSWPLRLLQQCRTAHVEYKVIKLFGVNYEDRPTTSGSNNNNNNSNRRSCCDSEEPGSALRSLPSRGQLSHDSADLEICIRDNISVVPSYSEALLMDAAPRRVPRGDPYYYPQPLVAHSPDDPYQGRNVTTPTEDPPDYEEALRLPVLLRLRRSLTDRGDLCRSSATIVNPRVGRTLINIETSL